MRRKDTRFLNPLTPGSPLRLLPLPPHPDPRELPSCLSWGLERFSPFFTHPSKATALLCAPWSFKALSRQSWGWKPPSLWGHPAVGLWDSLSGRPLTLDPAHPLSRTRSHHCPGDSLTPLPHPVPSVFWTGVNSPAELREGARPVGRGQSSGHSSQGRAGGSGSRELLRLNSCWPRAKGESKC